MRLYWEIARRAFRRAMIYRTAYLAGLLTNAFFGAVRSYVYIALYGAGGSVAGFTLQDAISYTWITQALISIGAGWVWWDLSTAIRSGEVLADLSRPWNFYGYWMSRILGAQVFNMLVRGSLTYLIGVLYFRAHVPQADQALAFVGALGLAMLVSFAFNFLINLTAFWLIDNTGVALIANILLSFFSGMLLPLAFFPPALAAVARALPFHTITSLPAEVFLGHLSGSALGWSFALQIFWALVLTIGATLALRAAVWKVVIQGG